MIIANAIFFVFNSGVQICAYIDGKTKNKSSKFVVLMILKLTWSQTRTLDVEAQALVFVFV